MGKVRPIRSVTSRRNRDYRGSEPSAELMAFEQFLTSRLKDRSITNQGNTLSTPPVMKTYKEYLQEARNELAGLNNNANTGLNPTSTNPNKPIG